MTQVIRPDILKSITSALSFHGVETEIKKDVIQPIIITPIILSTPSAPTSPPAPISCTEDTLLEENHPYLRPMKLPPNNGNPVESIEDLLDKKKSYDDILKSNGVKPTPHIKVNLSALGIKFTSESSTVNIDQKWTLMDIVEKKPPAGWISLFKSAMNELQDISSFLVLQEQTVGPFTPYKKDILRALELCPLYKVSVVILGQDPYYTSHRGVYDANGLAFSVNRDMDIPQSLMNIFTVLGKTVPDFSYQHGDLSSWAEQGVLLLNTALTTTLGTPDAHKGKWAGFITRIIHAIDAINPNCIYVLWGEKASDYQRIITSKNVLTSSHPSPKSAMRGFMQCDHFNMINTLLVGQGKNKINWTIS